MFVCSIWSGQTSVGLKSAVTSLMSIIYFLCVCEIINHKQTKLQTNVIKSCFNVMVCITFCYWMSDSESTLKKNKTI